MKNQLQANNQFKIVTLPHLTAQAWFFVSKSKTQDSKQNNQNKALKTQIILVDGKATARAWAEQLDWWPKQLAVKIPPTNLVLNAQALDRLFATTIKPEAEILITPLNFWSEISDPSPWILPLRPDLNITPNEVATWFDAQGFVSDPQLNEKYSFYRRGDQVLWHYGELTGQISWIGDVIETLKINGLNIPKISFWPTPAKLSKRKNSEPSLGDWLAQQNTQNYFIWDNDLHDAGQFSWLKTWRQKLSGLTFSLWHKNDDEPVAIRLPEIYRGYEQAPNIIKNFPAWKFICISPEDQDWAPRLLQLPTLLKTPRLQSFLVPAEKFGLLSPDILRQPVNPLKIEGPSGGEELRAELGSITIGTYVVHRDHGVGIFSGFTTQDIDKITRDYALITYADNDKLFVPIDQIDRLEKYVGSGTPKIHRLHGGAWQAQEQSARAATRLMAAELLTLYAERELLPAPIFPDEITDQESLLISAFPYPLTPDQDSAVAAINHDLTLGRPMERLLAGDVGFGKTEVALRAAARVLSHGGQVAWIAPTTILAQQHFDTIRQRLMSAGWIPGNLCRLSRAKEQKITLTGLADGSVSLVVGTTRLLSTDVQFKNLQLLIIDEEQRFGVKDKEKLKDKKTNIHVLSLTATPIPRTLNLSLAGVRDISFLRTAPPGRQPITTEILPADDQIIVKACEREFNRGGQVYILHNDVQSINSRREELQKIMPGIKIAIAHGQLNEKDLLQAMVDFDTGTAQVLLCSTIIENGLDLPNANTLIVEQATDFGLSQLYQLRGRIGRSQVPAYAYFLYDRQRLAGLAQERLSTLQELNKPGDGLAVAMRDLELRGVGDVLGSEQSGKIADIGLGLFTRLLDEAVQELKTGVAFPTSFDLKISGPFTFGLPPGRVNDQLNPETKLQVYQKFGRYFDLKLLEREISDWEIKYKLSEEELADPRWVNLKLIWQIKVLARKLGLIEIRQENSASRKFLALYFNRNLNWSGVKKLLMAQNSWQSEERILRLPELAWGKNPLTTLLAALKIYSESN